jgi:hypothetical protein
MAWRRGEKLGQRGVTIEDADDEAELVDAEPCPPGVRICAGIDPWSTIHHIGIRSLSGIVFTVIGRDRDNDQLMRS